MAIEFVHGCHDAILEFLFGCDADVAEHGAGELGKETLDEVEPGAMLGREGELKAASKLVGQPSLGLLGDMGRVIIKDQPDRRMGRIGSVDKLEKFDKFATAVAILDESVNLAGEQINIGFHRLIQRLSGTAKMPIRIHPYMLRHACGYKLANDGRDTRALQHYLGHKNIQHTVRYTELAVDRFKDFWR
jgi:hypothetical protein